MDKVKVAVIIFFIGFGLYQVINVGILASIPIFIAAAILFLVLCRGWDYFGKSATGLGLIALFISFVDITSSSNAFNVNDIGKTNEMAMQSGENRYCPVSNQPNEIKREMFNKFSHKLFELCVIQNYKNISSFALDLSKAVYLDPVMGTVDSFYNEFFNEKDKPTTCLEFAQKMDQLCPGLLEL
ncbi:hypothetical protein E4630_11640 [Aeromonas hydrophila]|uniref:hypothetical protein n=1 Tax=Aeromonas hydrophila TaxID=644 RepID=UPI00107ECDC1|nr:hypothetical protein [Aeromonas hydrophila]QBX71461.1 hypothetical protein E4625_11860 [Aeromonas hydrophila]QBX76161.1 hypothetical protein E4630_11640 [Aeromonas hydrophila]